MQLVRGVVTALLTPFTKTGEVDTKRIQDLVAYQISNRVNGFFVCGSTGLFPLLTLEERKAIGKAVIEEVSGKIRVIVHAGCVDTSSTVELARHSEDIGADAVACVTPYYYRLNTQSLVEHYKAVARSIDIPTFVYNIPENTGFNVTPAILQELSKNSGVSGIKDSSRDFTQLVTFIDTMPEDFTIITGTENHFYAALTHGASGMVSVAANVVPEICVEVYRAFASGEHKRARALQLQLNRIRNSLPQPAVPALYEILRMKGLDAGYPRKPFTEAHEREKQDIHRFIETISAEARK